MAYPADSDRSDGLSCRWQAAGAQGAQIRTVTFRRRSGPAGFSTAAYAAAACLVTADPELLITSAANASMLGLFDAGGLTAPSCLDSMAIGRQWAEAPMEVERIDKVFEALTFEWGEPGGFFFDLRDRKFNQLSFDRTIQLLESIDFENQKMIPKSIVGLIWSIPFFMEYNSNSISGIDEKSLYKAKWELYRIVENKLESP